MRGLRDVTEKDAFRRFGPINPIGWTVGHLAWHEHRYWLEHGQGRVLFPELNRLYAYGSAPSAPSLPAMLEMWHAVTRAADPYLDGLTTARLLEELLRDGRPVGRSIGSALRRVTYHYWYHIGEIQAVRQLLEHPDRPEYVGDIEIEAPYRPE